MSHSGITPLTSEQVRVASGMLLPSGEANFFEFKQHTSSDWDSTTPTGDVYYSASGSWSTRNPNYLVKNSTLRHKEFLLTEGQDDGESADKYIVASGLNFPFPYPYNTSYPDNVYGEMFSISWWEASGIYQTYPEAAFVLIDKERQSGILHWEGFRQVENLSNSPNVAPLIPEVQFNKYIHYLPEFPYHKHVDETEYNIESPDYTDPSVNLQGLRNKQKRKYIEVEYLSDVKKRNIATGGLSYVYDEDGLFSGNKTNASYIEGKCDYPDGTCRSNVSQQACEAYPGAIWTSGESCED